MAVTIVLGKRHALAGLFLLVLGALLGVTLIAPLTAQGVTYYTRSASCAGLNFEPDSDSANFGNYGALRTAYNPSVVAFRCNAALPNGAIVTKVQFTVAQYYLDDQISCNLTRTGLAASTSPTDYVAMAGPLTTSGLGQGHYEAQRLSTSTITDATIDNASYAYWLQCGLRADATSGIYGADVIYKISSTKG